jgi:hypothetical protein
VDLIISGDINLNYLEETNRMKQLNALFETFNLISTVTFPARICASISTAIDNIFIDISKYDYHSGRLCLMDYLIMKLFYLLLCFR